MRGVYKTWFEVRDHFPKKARYVLGDRIDARFVQVLELLFVAEYQSPTEKLPTLGRVLTSIDILKSFVHLAWDMQFIDNKKYTTLSEGLDTAGKQVGGWRNGIRSKTPDAH